MCSLLLLMRDFLINLSCPHSLTTLNQIKNSLTVQQNNRYQAQTTPAALFLIDCVSRDNNISFECVSRHLRLRHHAALDCTARPSIFIHSPTGSYLMIFSVCINLLTEWAPVCAWLYIYICEFTGAWRFGCREQTHQKGDSRLLGWRLHASRPAPAKSQGAQPTVYEGRGRAALDVQPHRPARLLR